MSKSVKGYCIAVLIAAAAAACFMGNHLRTSEASVRSLRTALSESRRTWESVAAEKEALQDELRQVTNAVKDAKLTLDESTGRAQELRQDIAALTEEISALRQKLDHPD